MGINDLNSYFEKNPYKRIGDGEHGLDHLDLMVLKLKLVCRNSPQNKGKIRRDHWVQLQGDCRRPLAVAIDHRSDS